MFKNIFCCFLGVSFWIGTDTAVSNLQNVETYIQKQIVCAGLSISSCKLIKVRGMNAFVY